MNGRSRLALALSLVLASFGTAWGAGRTVLNFENPIRSNAYAAYSPANRVNMTLTQPLSLTTTLAGSTVFSGTRGSAVQTALSAQAGGQAVAQALVPAVPAAVRTFSQMQALAAEQAADQSIARAGPVGETVTGLVQELGQAGPSGQAATFSRVYAGQDHVLLGPGDNTIVELERDARKALGIPLKRKKKQSAFEEEMERGRILDWIYGNQAVYPVLFYDWLADRRSRGLAPPQGWLLEHLEMKLEKLNEAIQQFNNETAYRLPKIILPSLNILVDDLSDGLRTRASIQRRLREEGRSDVRRSGALNIFGEKFITEDFALSPTTSAEDLLLAVAHEVYAATGVGHWNVVHVIQKLARLAFNLDKVDQKHMEDKVHAALAWREEQGTKKAPKAQAQEIENESPFDTLAVPFDPQSLKVHHNIGSVEGDKPAQIPFQSAYLYFEIPNGRVALGIGSVPNNAPGMDRPISFWWEDPDNPAENKWRQIFLLTGEEIRNRSIHARHATDEEKDPGLMLSRGRFYREFLEHFDRAVREFLAKPTDPPAAAEFVEQVYRSFRDNFSREWGIPLPEFETGLR